MHLFFDLDGTLTNPREGITACIRHALTTLEAPLPPDADLDQWIGPPLQDSFLTWLGCPDRAAQAVQAYRDRFATVGLFENVVYDGILEMLTVLATGPYTLWVTTAKPHRFATQIIQHFQLTSLFAGVYGSELDGTRAHKGDLLAHVLHSEGIPPTAALMVGDRAHDVLGAQQNGLPAIGVLWGFGSPTELQDAGATALCKRPQDLPGMIHALP